jgi:asparagine synthase (glutamine-hydrolysing)
LCGLTGILTRRDDVRASLDGTVRAMAGALAHRGPDDDGTWSDAEAGVALGFRRLAIIDLSPLGHQPMRSPSGRFTLVFNGEVFNHDELRRELEGEGVAFRGRSDTEVIAAAFERWGVEAAVRRFVGMFAIAAWDAERRALSLVRDRLGIKPLFWSARDGTLVFGSELKALAAFPGFDRTVDPDALAAYLRYLYVPAPACIYAHARKLPPGTILTLHSPDDAAEPVPYWRAEDAARNGEAERMEAGDEELTDELERLLTRVVEMRMHADVPLGALLSGGIDSSLVVSLMQAASARPVRTYAVAFEAAEHDEAHHAAAVARHLGTQHTELRVTGREALEVVPRLAEMYDEPLANPSQIPTYLVCALARREVTVALTGDGGDEVFAGYNRYRQGAALIPRLAPLPRPVRRAAAAAAGGLSPAGWDRVHGAAATLVPALRRQRLAGERIGKVGELLRHDGEAAMYRSLLSAWQNPAELLRGAVGDGDAVTAAFAAGRGLPLLDRMMLADQGTYLPDDLLAKVDRASMAASLEARVPLLDHRVVEMGWRLPRRALLRGGVGKWLLRQVLYRHVPREMVERPKMGFTVPVAEWLRGPLRAWGDELMASRGLADDPFLRADVVRARWSAFQAGRGPALGMWAVLSYLGWKARWVP